MISLAAVQKRQFSYYDTFRFLSAAQAWNTKEFGLLWLPPMMQEDFDPTERVIECGLL
jgi:hypothetical protein